MLDKKFALAAAVAVCLVILVSLLINNSQLRSELQAQQVEIMALQAERQLLTDKSVMHEKTNADLQKQVRAAQAQLVALQQQTAQIVQVLRDSVSELKSEVEASQAQLNQYQSR